VSEINWSSLKKTADDAIKPLDVGRYRFMITRPDVRQASTGSWMIVVHLVVQGGDRHGKDLMNNFVMAPDSAFALNRWFKNFEAIGITESFWTQLSQSGLNLEQSLRTVASAIDGRLVEAEVDIKLFRDQQRNEFVAFYPVPQQPSVGNPSVFAQSSPSGTSGPSGAPPVPVIPGGGVSTPSVPISVPTVSVSSAPVPPKTPVAPPNEPF